MKSLFARLFCAIVICGHAAVIIDCVLFVGWQLANFGGDITPWQALVVQRLAIGGVVASLVGAVGWGFTF